MPGFETHSIHNRSDEERIHPNDGPLSSDTEATVQSDAAPAQRTGRRRRGRGNRSNTLTRNDNMEIKNISPDAWQIFDDINLQEEFGYRLPTMQEIPFFMRTGLREAYTVALARIRDTRQGSELERSQAWKLFILTSRMLLNRVNEKGKEGK